MKSKKFNLLWIVLLLAACHSPQPPVQRYAQVAKISQDQISMLQQHANPDESVLEALKDNNIHNYSLYVGEVQPDSFFAFRYFEYNGQSLESTVSNFSKNPLAGKWWNLGEASTEGLSWTPWEQIFYFAGSAEAATTDRFGWIIGIHQKDILAYMQLHAAPWPGVIKQLGESHIKNYSIYLGELDKDHYLLFSYLEYTGENFEADMAKMGEDEITQLWWSYTDPLQYRLPTAKEGEHWSTMRKIIFLE